MPSVYVDNLSITINYTIIMKPTLSRVLLVGDFSLEKLYERYSAHYSKNTLYKNKFTVIK